MQEETLQLESLDTEDTGINQVNPMQDQDSESLQAQNIGETEVPDAQDTSDTQIQDDGTDSQLNGKEHDPDIPISFMQMLKDYLHAYLPPLQADTYLQIQGMAQWLDMYLSKYLAQYINCMTSDSEFVAFVNHAI